MMKHKLCKHCFIPIYKDTRTGYCTKYCQQLAERDPCPVCGKSFFTDSKAQVYCSRECLAESLRKEKPTHICENCGKQFARFPNTKDSCRFCSRECSFERFRKDPTAAPAYKDGSTALKKAGIGRKSKIYYKTCRACGKTFVARSMNAKLCSGECRKIDARNQAYFYNLISYYKAAKPVKCRVCNKMYIATYGNKKKKLCSDECAAELRRRYNALHRKERKARRRCLIASNYIEPVSLKYLFFRDKARCQICSKKLNLIRAVPHNLAATIDHIVPLSKGGEHSKKNTQLACFKCNSLKGDRCADGGDQLLLFG